MIVALRDRTHQLSASALLVGSAVLGLAYLTGSRPSLTLLGLLIAGVLAFVLLRRPVSGLPLLVCVALLLPLEIGTGTEVKLNPVTLFVIALVGVWALHMMRTRQLSIVHSRVNLPLFLFLLASLVSLFVGNLLWDPAVPRSGTFIVVQLAQWAIFVLSACAFWLTANLVQDEAWLQQLTMVFLLVAGGVAVLSTLPGFGGWIDPITTVAFIRAPLWMLLAAVAAGQLFFNPNLTIPWRLFLVGVLAAVFAYAFVEQQEAASNWVAIAAVAGTLVWLRFPKLRWMILVGIVVLAIAGQLLPAVYEYAGGDAEWRVSGGSRLSLITRVVEDTLSHNPITGLGPAAYRAYGATQPLIYLHIIWANPRISSHNNYVDLFAHTGVVGLFFFFWFAWALFRVGLRLHHRHTSGFLAGYVNGMLAAGAGALVVMLLADWMLPFVYNIGFPGFQASVLVWLFLGGLVAIANMPEASEESPI